MLSAAFAPAQPTGEWRIETVAGTGDIGDGGPAVQAHLYYAPGVAVDRVGNLYIADSLNKRIRKVDAAGVISTVAGTSTSNLSEGDGYDYGGDGGPAVQAQLNSPSGVAVDGSGNLYIADTYNHRIRKVDAAGFISTVAGTGVEGFSGDGGPAVQAQLTWPEDVAVDSAGNLYIADRANQRIRKVDASTGNISTVAGSGRTGSFEGSYGGDGGPAILAQLNGPSGVAVDGSGNLYIADKRNHRIRKVDAAGLISTVAGTGDGGWHAFGLDEGSGSPAVQAQLYSPEDVAVDGSGNLYIADRRNHRIRKVDPAGLISTVAGTGGGWGYSGDGGPAANAHLAQPVGVAVDGAGNLYIADGGNNRIRKVDDSDIISTVAGNGKRNYSGDGGDGGGATSAQLNSPSGVAVDGAGNLYIADLYNRRIRKVDAAGVISTVAGNGVPGFSGDGGPATQAQLNYPRDAAVDGAGNLYIADAYNNSIRKVDAAGIISTVAGNGVQGFSGDGGPATAAQLNSPHVAVDTAGNLYIADNGNHRIRKVDAFTGIISTVAGNGVEGFSGDGGPAIQAQLTWLQDVAVDRAGNLYIATWTRIRKVDAFTGNISTVAGNGVGGDSGDGGPATAARLYPHDIAVDRAGNLYIANNNRIRKVDAAGVIFTVAGNGRLGYSGDGGPAAQAHLARPEGVAVDAAGNLYIADTLNHRIRRLTPPGPRISSGGVVLATGSPVVNRISPNAIVSIFGHEFSPEETRAASPALNAAGRVVTELAGLCLEIDGKRAPLFAVFPGQINAQAPHDLTPGQAQIRAIGNCGAEDEQRGFGATVEVAALAPAFFNFPIDASGRNPIVALRGNGPELVGLPGAVPNIELTPAEPGEIVTFFGTGFGPTDPPLEAGQIPGGVARLTSEIEFAFGNITLFPEDVLYAGAAPCCAGLYQFAVRVPRRFPDGRAPVIAAVEGVSTPEGPFITIRSRE